MPCRPTPPRPQVRGRGAARGAGPSPADDAPLQLRSTSRWRDGGWRVWDIVADLLYTRCGLAAHANPFEVELSRVRAEPPLERCLLAGSLGLFLKDVLPSAQQLGFADAVQADMQALLEIHYRDLARLVPQPDAKPAG